MNTRSRIFACLMLLALFAAGNLFAQDVKGTFTLPFEVNWGGAVLEPGEYTFHLDAANSGIMAVHWDGRTVYIKLGYTDELKGSNRRSELIMVASNNKPIVSELYVANLRTAFRFTIPLKGHVTTSQGSTVISRAEPTEPFARIPVMIAGK